jgi:hypothetical protein
MLFGTTDPRRYAALRIAFGLLAFLTLLGLWPECVFYYSDAGWFPLPTALAMTDAREWSLLHWISGPLGVRLFFLAAMAASLSMAAGYRTRAASIATFIAIVSIQSRNWLNTYGGDAVLRLMLPLIALSPAGAVWSLDAAKRRKKAEAPVWPLRLIQVQVCLVYFVAGWLKLHGRDWVNGSALSLVLMNPIFARADYGALTGSPGGAWLLKAATQATLAWELGFPLLMLNRWTRLAALAFGVAVHLGIVLLLQIHWFGWIMIASYLAFIPEEWFETGEKYLMRARRLMPVPA